MCTTNPLECNWSVRPGTGTGTRGYTLGCDGPDNCKKGEVCCFSRDPIKPLGGSTCAAQCAMGPIEGDELGMTREDGPVCRADEDCEDGRCTAVDFGSKVALKTCQPQLGTVAGRPSIVQDSVRGDDGECEGVSACERKCTTDNSRPYDGFGYGACTKLGMLLSATDPSRAVAALSASCGSDGRACLLIPAVLRGAVGAVRGSMHVDAEIRRGIRALEGECQNGGAAACQFLAGVYGEAAQAFGVAPSEQIRSHYLQRACALGADSRDRSGAMVDANRSDGSWAPSRLGLRHWQCLMIDGSCDAGREELRRRSGGSNNELVSAAAVHFCPLATLRPAEQAERRELLRRSTTSR